ncbi:hypothetical protein TrLO_g9723 [Triparma laevis f. longispina]|uniref:Uncharacterized protein n=1 Tax=Triparma laevis f. longispina TaxID=1714387 RepID=A0A9W7C7N1_9STRA|nr:hypothetical protein TrLO_g9723 [Triparma laevis f. longispina]
MDPLVVAEERKAVHVKWKGKTIALGTFAYSVALINVELAKKQIKLWKEQDAKYDVEWVKAELEKQGLRKVLKRATEYKGEVEDLKLYTKTGKRVKKIPADFGGNLGPGLTKFNERRGGKGDGNGKGKEDGRRGGVGGGRRRGVKKGKSLVNVQEATAAALQMDQAQQQQTGMQFQQQMMQMHNPYVGYPNMMGGAGGIQLAWNPADGSFVGGGVGRFGGAGLGVGVGVGGEGGVDGVAVLQQDTMREAYEQHMQRINQEEVDRRLLQHHQQEVRQHELELQQQQQIQQRHQELVAAYKNQQQSSALAPKQTADQTVVTESSTPTNLTDPAPSVLPISLNSFGNAFFDSSLPSTASLAPPPVTAPKIKPVEEMTGSELDSTVVSMTVAQINRLWSHINYYKEKAEKLLLENGRLKVRKGERGGREGVYVEV